MSCIIDNMEINDPIETIHDNSTTITVITGLSGSGKTTFLNNTIIKIRETQPSVKIVSINPKETRWSHIAQGEDLIGSLKGFGIGPTALFIDNVDRILHFEKAIQILLDEKALSIYLTGKNTWNILKMLKHISTKEIREIRIHPINYTNYLTSKKLTHTTGNLYQFLHIGGLPKISSLPEAIRYEYLEKTMDSIILNEIIESSCVRDVCQFKAFLAAMAFYTGQTISTRKICRWFAQRNSTISPQTTLDFMGLCENAGILMSIPVQNISDKKILQGSKVWYFGDVGIRTVCGTYAKKPSGADDEEIETNKAIENALFLFLVDNGWQIFHGKLDTTKKNTSSQLTFICIKNNIQKYIQYCPLNTREAAKFTLKNTLLSIPDGWQKIMIDTDSKDIDSDGIHTLSFPDIKEFLD